MTKHVHGVRACDVKFYNCLIVWGGVVCLWCVLGGVHLENRNIYFLPCTHARDTGGPGAFACNLPIFLCEIVTCMSYGATFRVIPIGYGVFPRRIYSDCTYQITSCQ